MFTCLQADGLILRELRESDYSLWLEGYEKSLVSQNAFDASYLEPKEQNQAFFLNLIKQDKKAREIEQTFNFYAFNKDESEFIGGSQLWDIKRGGLQSATLGFWVLNNHWRKGFGYKIGKATINYGFEILKLNRIEAGILPDNKSSLRLCEKLGLKFEGIKRQALWVNQKFEDHALYATIASDRNTVI